MRVPANPPAARGTSGTAAPRALEEVQIGGILRCKSMPYVHARTLKLYSGDACPGKSTSSARYFWYSGASGVGGVSGRAGKVGHGNCNARRGLLLVSGSGLRTPI